MDKEFHQQAHSGVVSVGNLIAGQMPSLSKNSETTMWERSSATLIVAWRTAKEGSPTSRFLIYF
jgi:hypothetical protein